MELSAEDINRSTESATEPAPSSICADRVLQDHLYDVRESPRSVKRKLEHAVSLGLSARKRLKYSQAKVHRLSRKVKSLTDIIVDLRKQNLISENCSNLLSSTCSGIPEQLMRRIVSQKAKKPTRASYPDELKSFALTLSFYSTKAYNYVRKCFKLALPHPSTLRQWYSGLNCQPGFTEEAFRALSVRVKEATSSGKQVICSLMLDEMAIRKQIEWNGEKFVGYVDIGTDIDDDSAPVATEALVFMVVALNDNWKIPVAYFMIDGMNGVERANLVKQCLLKLHDFGVSVKTLTCDGPSCNFSMMPWEQTFMARKCKPTLAIQLIQIFEYTLFSMPVTC